MTLTNATFEQWLVNHSVDHDDKWCRELYPFHVFSRINFDTVEINKEQRIDFNRIYYYALITKIELQENGRYKATFGISTVPSSKSQAWKNRKWDTTFQIVYAQDFRFITAFTKKEDPSKDFVTRFMKGDFTKINESKSLPVSELLFKTLIAQLAEESFPSGSHYQLFGFDPNGIRNLPEHPEFGRKQIDFAPIYSVGRDLWICYSFTEEKAHRIAFYTANQSKDFIAIYCNPTYTKHHRCKYENTAILSLYEFANKISTDVRRKYEPQIRFLQNHLNRLQSVNSEQLLHEINNPKQEVYEIQKSDLMEALGIMKIMPNDTLDFFHSLAAVNLINAFLTQKRQQKSLNSKKLNLFRNMYYFKTYLSEIISGRVDRGDFSIPIYIKGDLTMVEILGFQFSFHNMPKDEILKRFESSDQNKVIIWLEKRLQPIAPLILHYSRALRDEGMI